MPGASPPLVSTPIRFTLCKELTPFCGSGIRETVLLIQNYILHHKDIFPFYLDAYANYYGQ
jgi:hypothetical protein